VFLDRSCGESLFLNIGKMIYSLSRRRNNHQPVLHKSLIKKAQQMTGSLMVAVQIPIFLAIYTVVITFADRIDVGVNPVV